VGRIRPQQHLLAIDLDNRLGIVDRPDQNRRPDHDEGQVSIIGTAELIAAVTQIAAGKSAAQTGSRPSSRGAGLFRRPIAARRSGAGSKEKSHDGRQRNPRVRKNSTQEHVDTSLPMWRL
jgi:hypothetical protein